MWEFAARSLNASTVFTIAALGELIGQRSGILNVGIEGVMLFGATLGFIVAKTTGSYLLGLLAAVAIGGLIAALHGFFSITLGGDQVVNGMGIWILGFGLTAYIGYPYTGPLGLERIPDLAGLSPFFFLAVGLVVLTWWMFSKTSLGLRIRSAGESPSVTEVSGINVTRTRYLSVMVSGMLMGLARGDLLPELQPGVEHQLPAGVGLHCAGAGLLLHVESLHPVRRVHPVRHAVAALAQPSAGPARAFCPGTSGGPCRSSSPLPSWC